MGKLVWAGIRHGTHAPYETLYIKPNHKQGAWEETKQGPAGSGTENNPFADLSDGISNRYRNPVARIPWSVSPEAQCSMEVYLN
jgi:hypothetical protein